MPKNETPSKKLGRPINHAQTERTVPRSVALYPSQWRWLEEQGGSVSGAIQRLVREAIEKQA